MTEEERLLFQEINLRHKTESLRSIQKDFKISLGSLARFRDGHVPQKPEIRKALGLPAYLLTQVCSVCNIVHTKQCKPKFKDRLIKNVSLKEALSIYVIYSELYDRIHKVGT